MKRFLLLALAMLWVLPSFSQGDCGDLVIQMARVLRKNKNSYRIEYKVKNIGQAPVELIGLQHKNFNVQGFYSKDNRLDHDDAVANSQFLTQAPVSNLESGQSTLLTFDIFSTAIPPTTNYFLLRIGSVASKECDDNNNVGGIPIVRIDQDLTGAVPPDEDPYPCEQVAKKEAVVLPPAFARPGEEPVAAKPAAKEPVAETPVPKPFPKVPMTDEEDHGLHTVQEGETVESVAAKFQVSVNYVLLLNGMDDANTPLVVGSQIRFEKEAVALKNKGKKKKPAPHPAKPAVEEPTQSEPVAQAEPKPEKTEPVAQAEPKPEKPKKEKPVKEKVEPKPAKPEPVAKAEPKPEKPKKEKPVKEKVEPKPAKPEPVAKAEPKPEKPKKEKPVKEKVEPKPAKPEPVAQAEPKPEKPKKEKPVKEKVEPKPAKPEPVAKAEPKPEKPKKEKPVKEKVEPKPAKPEPVAKAEPKPEKPKKEKPVKESDDDFTPEVYSANIDPDGCADLRLDSISLVSFQKKKAVVKVTVTNTGSVPANFSGKAKGDSDDLSWKAYLSGDRQLNRGDIFSDGAFMKQSSKNEVLAAGASTVLEFTVDLPKYTRYTSVLIINVDALQVLGECNESNNSSSIILR